MIQPPELQIVFAVVRWVAVFLAVLPAAELCHERFESAQMMARSNLPAEKF